MIRIVLLGRTGNNMFQYALGRVLAERHQVPLVLDGSWFNATGWQQVSHFLGMPLHARVVRRFSLGARTLRKLTGKHYWEYRGVPVLRESPADQSFDSRLLDAPAECVLVGYFQTPMYFDHIAAELRNELNGLLKDSWSERNKGARAFCQHPSLPPVAAKDLAIAERIQSPESVAVHVRRTDYLHHPAFQVCGDDYHRRAMDEMRNRIDKPRFYIFSDDPEWCRATFTDPDQEVVDSEPGSTNPLHDLRLMSLASHHIMVNSTYSWWAAWLGEKPGQQVFMPHRWYARDIKAPIEEKRMEHWTVIAGERRCHSSSDNT